MVRWLVGRVLGAIRVQEKKFKQDAPEVQEAIAALDRGACVVIFPEGFTVREMADRVAAVRDIAIEGFTDSIGSPDSNQRLSERRAQAVKDALTGRGIESRRIDARGFGPSFPVASNATETGRQLNRRVEIVINPS